MTLPKNLGLDFPAHALSGGRLALDGGTMFGPVPRVLWETKITPDARHRVLMETNCVLFELAGQRVLIDAGYGGKADPKKRAFQGLEEGEPILRSLRAVNVEPNDIALVILSHLHFDHVGGCTRVGSSGKWELVFPRAKHFVQKAEWDDATQHAPELLGSFFDEDFLPIENAGLLEQVDGDAEILPGLVLKRIGGHTRGMQIIEIGRQPNGAPAALFLADLVPSTLHLRTFWQVSYDQFPLDVRREKPKLLGQVADGQTLALFCHDIQTPAAYLKRDPKQEFTVTADNKG